MKLGEELQMSAFKDNFQKVLLNIIFTANWLDNLTKQRLKSLNLTSPQYNVLRILRGQKGVPLSAFSIQRRMVHRSSNITRILDKLAAKGLANRIECDENRRKVDITITGKGLELLALADQQIEFVYKKLKAAITNEEAVALNELMEQIRNDFSSKKNSC